MKLYLIRHGETDFNKFRRWQGQVDTPLNNTGRLQASKMHQWLIREGVELDCIYTSPLCRATETAQIINPNESKTVVDKRLTEINMGEFDGRNEDDLIAELGQARYDQWRNQMFQVPAPGGESIFEVIQRVRHVIGDILSSSQFNRLGVVAHQGVLVAIKSVISNRSDQDSLRSFRQKNNEIDIWTLNPMAHLTTVEL